LTVRGSAQKAVFLKMARWPVPFDRRISHLLGKRLLERVAKPNANIQNNMKTNTLSLEGSRTGGQWSRALLFSISLFLCLAGNVSAAGKGKPGLTRATWIDVQFTFEDLAYGLASDGLGSYVHDELNVSAQLGTVENINLVLNKKFRKPAIRHFTLCGGPLEDLADAALMVGLAAPDFSGAVVPKGMFQILGDNLDELVGTIQVPARLMLDDDSGHAWEVWYTLSLTRNSTTEWGFEAAAGVLYGYPEGNGPDGPVPVGEVDLPLSGIVEPLAN
jgi:hypothetical protein